LIVVLIGAPVGCGDRAGLLGRRRRASERPLPTPVRAVWVARFHYRTPEDIRTILRNCAALGFNTVLWQVRGNGTVMYPSRIEPWAEEYGHKDPGFDPLALAVREAHANGLRIEAWINLLPGWRGPDPPPMRSQLWYAHPDWFLRDASGRRQPLAVRDRNGRPRRAYLILNPCLPQVRDYLCDVVDEIVSRYDVDGVHLDYVRYAWDGDAKARQRYPRDPQTLRLYRRDTGKHPDDDPQAWDAWRANQLTRLVEQIRRTVQRYPGLTLTAAVMGDPRRAYREHFQNGVAWLRAGVLDAAYVMAYTKDARRFKAYVEAYRALAPRARIIPGLGVYTHETPEMTATQLDLVRSWDGDFAVFSYASLHAAADDRGTSRTALEQKNRRRRWRRNLLHNFTRSVAGSRGLRTAH